MYKRGLILALGGLLWSVVAYTQSGPPLLNGSPAITNVDATFRNVGVKSVPNGQCLTVSGTNHYITGTGSACGGGGGGGISAGTGITLTGGGTIVNLTVPVTAPLGGTGNTTNTAHGFMLGEGTSALTSLVCGSGTLPFGGGAAADPTCRLIANADLPTSGVSAGTYTLATVTVNAQGIVTSASSGTAATASRLFFKMDDTGVVNPALNRISDSLNLATSNIVIDNCTWSWAGWSGCSTFPVYTAYGNCTAACSGGGTGDFSTATMTGTQTSNSTGTTANTCCAPAEMYLKVTTAAVGCAQSAGLSRTTMTCQYHMQ